MIIRNRDIYLNIYFYIINYTLFLIQYRITYKPCDTFPVGIEITNLISYRNLLASFHAVK
jgi:hypothetical protein